LDDSLAGPDRKVEPTVGTNAQVGLELIVSVVRIALRARVGVRRLVPRFLGKVAVLDGDVDLGGHASIIP